MAKMRQPGSHAVAGVFVFLLLGIFAVMATVMVLMGVKAYRAAVERGSEHNERRIASSYLRSMLRAEDKQDGVYLETIDGVECISLRDVYDGEEFVTRIYVYDGMLREWFTSAEEPFIPADGEDVCPADAMTAELSGDGVLTVRLRKDDTWNEVICSLRAAVQSGVD